MRFERGPFGRIAVKTVLSDDDVVLHALDVLQNHVISSILPVYLREQTGKVQLCIDCTGYTQLCEHMSHEWGDIWERKKISALFLRAIIDARDHFMDSDLFVMDAKYIFFDPSVRKLYWSYLPIARKNSDSNENSSSHTCEKLELLLMDSFFSESIEEGDRNQILCLFREEREEELMEFLRTFGSNDSVNGKSSIRKDKLSLCLMIQLILMSVCFAFLMFWEGKQISPLADSSWTSWYLIVFTCLLIINLVIGRDKSRSPVFSEAVNEYNSNKKISVKDMYFPANGITENKYKINSQITEFSPAFLTQQITHARRDCKPLRAVVWVEDFLIGKDKSLCDFFVDNSSVSDRHARILHRGTTFFLMDLGSVSGTWIGSRRLYSYEESPLTDGDILMCGEMRFIFNHTA